MRRVTLKEVANQLELSRITVSKVINGKPGVSLETQKRVIRKLLDSGYDKLTDEQIRLVEKPRDAGVKSVAVITIAPDFSEFWLNIINAVSRTLNREGYNFIYSILAKGDNNRYDLPKTINREHVSGIIAINVYDDLVIRSILELGMPTVFLDTTPSMFRNSREGDLVLLDGSRSVFEITSHLADLGISNFGFMGDITYAQTIRDRWTGFRDALNERKISLNPQYCFTSSPRGHFYSKEEVVEHLKKLSSFPRAFVCANDFIAFMVIDYLKKRGFRVPQDIMVSGYDDIRERITAESHLTTVHVDTEILGQRLVRQILFRLAIPDMPREIIYIRPKVIYRQSTETGPL
jgi:LacI family transcriptional regulator